MNRLHVSSGGRYPVLRALAILQLLSSILIGIGGVVGAIYVGNWAGHAASFGDKMIIALGGLAATFFLVILSLAFAELLKLLIDIEYNTRMAATGGTDMAGGANATMNRGGRGSLLDGDETAEGALLRGH